MNILMIAINDPAGTAIAFTNAINRHTNHSCRLITKEIRYNFMFDKDIHLPWLDSDENWQEVEHLLRISDIFHFHMTADEDIEIGPFKPKDFLKGKTIVHHHHGHPDFRGDPGKYRDKYKQRKRKNFLVSTPDLMHLFPEATWQPNLVPLDDPLYTPLEDKPENPIIICHSPTCNDLKNTSEFVKAASDVGKTSDVPIELRIIENTPHKECLRKKRESHILFDHLQGYFGVSSLEGLSHGLCVIANLDRWTQEHIRAYTQTDKLPWVITDKNNLGNHLSALVESKEERDKIGNFSRKFMNSFWTDQIIVNSLIKFYQNSN